jgi:hypothetical protein
MAFKMKGAPMHDTSSKHGTNANYKKSGAPGLLGKILDPLGLKKKIFGGKGGNCPPAPGGDPAAAPAAKPAEPAAAAPAAAAPAAAAPEEAAAAAAPMKEGLMKDSPARDNQPRVKGHNKPGESKHNHAMVKHPAKQPKDIPGEKFRKDVKPKGKGGAPMKDSPMRGEKWDAVKNVAGKAWDKATQVGMGLKGAWKAADVPVGSKTTFPGARSVKGFKEGYEREKKHDEAKNKKNKKK